MYVKTLLLGSDNLPRAVGTVIYSLQHKIYTCLLIIMHLTCLVRFKYGPVYTLYREKLSLEAFAHYYEKKDDPLPKPRANNRTHARFDCLAFNELTWLGKWKSLYSVGRKVCPARRVTPLGRSPFWPSQPFVSHLNSFQVLWGNAGKVGSPMIAWLAGRWVTLLPGTSFLQYK